MKNSKNIKIKDIDTANIISSFTPPTDFQTLDLISKFSYLRFSNLYQIMDETIRDSILYIANDLGLGIGLGIIGASMAVKLLFGPFMLLAVDFFFVLKKLKKNQPLFIVC